MVSEVLLIIGTYFSVFLVTLYIYFSFKSFTVQLAPVTVIVLKLVELFKTEEATLPEVIPRI